jgi:uncharacterized RDD family membrane protein YckC
MFVEEKYQTFSGRFWAGFIDFLVLLPIGLVSMVMFSTANPKWLVIGWAIIYFASDPMYSVLMHANYGRTVGKRTMHVIVLDVSEQRIPSLKQAILRDIVLIVSQSILLANFIRVMISTGSVKHIDDQMGWFGQALSWATFVWFLLELVTMLFSSKRRALHDLIAGTVVVEVGWGTFPATANSR